MKTPTLPIPIAIAITITIGCGPGDYAESFPTLTGEYLGQTPPGGEPELFAPGIVSTGLYTRDIAMTPDGDEIYYGVFSGPFTVIMQTKLENGRWTEPEVAPFSADPRYMSLEPHITPDGQKFLFLSNRPADGSEFEPEQVGTWLNQDIWAMDRTADGWGAPYNLGPPVNSSDEEYFPSVTIDGTIYFSRQASGSGESYIYRSRLVDGVQQEAERLPPQVNSTAVQFNAFISPDESFLILGVVGRDDTMGGADYYIVFRDEEDRWSEPVNMGDAINTPGGGEWSPFVTHDGKYFFFMSSRRLPADEFPETLTAEFLWKAHKSPQNGNADIYWMDASFIDELRPPGFER